jgi:hypothetical protein
MKKLLIIPFLVSIIWVSCDEEPPPVRFTDPEKPLLDTVYTGIAPAPTPKMILLMDVTGVNCPNCPKAATLAKNLQIANPGRINVLALYPAISPGNALTNPWAGYDTLVTADADGIVSNLGSVTGLPTGIIDQIKLGGSFFIPTPSWAGTVTDRLTTTSPLNIDLASKWLTAENKARLEIKANYHSNLPPSAKHLIYIGVTEDNIVGKQANNDSASGYSYKYKFMHVLRKLMTPVTGDTLKENPAPGKIFEKHYYISPRYNWKPENLNAMVWIVDAATKEILQSAEVKLKP